MTDIYLYNSLRKTKELFTPLNPHSVGMYVCGPTVYDYVHIGNARAMVIFDILYRVLCQQYGSDHVKYVRNITDVDDKITNRAAELNISIQDLTTKTTAQFHHDMQAIGCIPLHESHPMRIEPKATTHIADMIKMCENLIAQNHAYAAEDHVLFNVQSFAAYGNLSRRSIDEMIAGARVEIAPYKKNPADFVLWKPSSLEEPGWNSPWGRGRPGWHLECSAMSTKYLGPDFDIHGGGADLQFPHHENEIAQSCCTYPNSQFAHYWIHNGFLTVNGEKMSKSLGNFITVHQLLEQNIQGEAIRFALLTTHYRKPLDWNDKGLDDALKAMNGFYHALSNLSEIHSESPLPDSFFELLADDLNIPKAVAYLHELLKASHIQTGSQQQQTLSELKACGQLLGLFNVPASQWLQRTNSQIDATEIETLIGERNAARTAKNWQRADEIRNLLTKQGIILKDNNDGTTSWYSN